MGDFDIISVKNPRVTNNSVVLEKFKILKKSVVADHCFAKYIKPSFLLKYAIPSFPFAKKNQNYILISDEWSKNYCHWLWEALSKLSILKKENPDAILVLPKSYLKINFIIKSLKAFGFDQKNILTINKKSHLKTPNLKFIGCINIATVGYYDFLKFSEVRDQIISYFADQLNINFGNKIYISRSDPAKNTARKVANEKETENLLARYGFKTVYMENYSFLEQVSIAYHADFIVSPHGAGITNAMFMKDGSALLELVNKDWQLTCFEEMINRMNIKYFRQDCFAKDAERTIHLSDIVVDIKNLEENLKLIGLKN